MKCFIASAFGRSDVDNNYKIVRSVLKSFNITALRVDKLSFNDKIDQKILSLIKSCDFCIADLTYARPSVYYEAGRVHGMGKEVIFSCRSDHFKGTEDDKKIHFDLITENVIGWKNTPTAFEKSLRTRIKQVILPIERAKLAKKKIDEEQQAFARLSVNERIKIIREQLFKSVRKTKYKIVPLSEHNSMVLGRRIIRKDQDELLFGHVGRSYPSNELRIIGGYGSLGAVRAINDKKPEWKQLKIGNCTFVICSLLGITDNSIQNAFPRYSKIDSLEKIYVNKKEEREDRVIVIDNIKSLPDFKVRIESVLA
jgi:hypothetical protein